MEKKDTGVFITLPIVDNTKKDPVTGAARPSKECVEQAKDWVDDGSRL
jgi:hypothetical protein